MQESDLPALTRTVLACAFALSVLFGAIAQRTRFCTMGAIADVVTFGDWTRMRMWVLAMATAIAGFNVMVGLGWLEARDSIYGGSRLLWVSTIVGGLAFGFGMVLASGCGSRNLVRLGGGNLKSLVVVMVLGVSAFATLKGITAVLRVGTVDRFFVEPPGGQDLPSLLSNIIGAAPASMALMLGVAISAGLLVWVLYRPEGRTADVLLGGIGIGAVIVAVWWVSGRLGHLAEHPILLEEAFLATNSRRMESLSFAAPVGFALDWVMFFSDASKVLTVGIVSVFGAVVGSAGVSLATRGFRWEGFANTEDVANHLIGATLMGFGGVTALGCTIGQGLSGLSTLSLGSAIAVASIVGGAVAALRYQSWRLDRES